jgi:hypothetical protein
MNTMKTHDITDRTTGSAVLLALTTPVLGEVCSGATRLSYLFAYIPQVLMWGCGTLLVREVVRRWHGGWPSLLALGLALSVWDEFLVQQTSLAPLPWVPVDFIYGRLGGVNWPYFLFMLAFESLTLVLIPIHVVERFRVPWCRSAWLARRGLWITSMLFLLGSAFSWVIWVKVAREQVFHMPPFHPSVLHLLSASAAILGLVAVGRHLARRPLGTPTRLAAPANPIWTGVAGLSLAAPWYLLMLLVFVPRPGLPPLWVPVLATLVAASFSLLLAVQWSSSARWGDSHSGAVALGLAVVCVGGGYLGVSTWSTVDVAFKLLVDLLVLALLLWQLATSMRREPLQQA